MKSKWGAERQWFTPVILATQEAEIRRIMVQSQPGQKVHKTLSWKKFCTKKKRGGGVVQDVVPEFKPQYHKKEEKKKANEELTMNRSG
jgi:hypothetical protein